MRLETTWTMVSKVEPFYYMLWKIMYELPKWVRYGIEIIILLMAVVLLFWLANRIVVILSYVLERGIGGIISGIQVLLILPDRWLDAERKEHLVRMDEELGVIGRSMVRAIQQVRLWLLDRANLNPAVKRKWLMISFLILFVLALLPEIQIIKRMNESYQEPFCIVQAELMHIEELLTPRMDEYPELFATAEVENEVEEIYLELNEKGKAGANIRIEPSLEADSIGIINSANKILYLGEKYYDGTRYWLKVEIDDGVIVGWLSEILVQQKEIEI